MAEPREPPLRNGGRGRSKHPEPRSLRSRGSRRGHGAVSGARAALSDAGTIHFMTPRVRLGAQVGAADVSTAAASASGRVLVVRTLRLHLLRRGTQAGGVACALRFRIGSRAGLGSARPSLRRCPTTQGCNPQHRPTHTHIPSNSWLADAGRPEFDVPSLPAGQTQIRLRREEPIPQTRPAAALFGS